MTAPSPHDQHLRAVYGLGCEERRIAVRESEARLNARGLTTAAQISRYRELVASGVRVNDAIAAARKVKQGAFA